MENLNNVEESTKTFTQDEVNSMIKERLDRAEKKWQEKYSNYYSEDDLKGKTEELTKQITDLGNSLNDANNKATADADEISKRDQTIADLENKVRNYETDSAKTRIALEVGIPFELANKLSGSTEEEIRKDAEALLPFVTKPIGMPSRNTEAVPEVDGVTAAFLKKNPSIKLD